jgi:2-polyprenyl-6-hydroxyphenyl methylase/3-demethylubiquinone-9 3-methyltransferase
MAMNEQPLRFGFGANWQSYIDTALSPARISRAVNSMREMLGVADLAGRSFLDIGCGSGIFSLAACQLGADQVAGFDYDADSVRASVAIRERAGIPADRWRIQQGSVLDPQFMASLAPADVVYSWGVLHHTGSMWEAIRAAALQVRPGGLFALSIYNDVRSPLMSSAHWRRIKQIYNRAPVPVRRAVEAGYASAFLLRDAAMLRNPLTTIRRYNSDDGRGMDFWHDVRDWLGGFPYEYASPGEVFTFLHRQLGFQLTYMNTSYGAGCNEFTFRRPG